MKIDPEFFPSRKLVRGWVLLFAVFLLFCVTGQQLIAEENAVQKITGQVTDAETGLRLPGVDIIVTNSTMGTTTDRNGRFELAVPLRVKMLSFSYLGYRQLTASIDENTHNLDIRLQPTALDAEPMIVTASRDEQLRHEAPVSISALSVRQLDELKPTMLYQALNSVSGVYMVDLGNEQHSMSIRQPITLKSLFLYLEDGIPLRPAGLFNHNALIEVNMSGLERVEVVKGPASSMYGSNAIGGAVNFITPRPSPVTEIRASLQGDDIGYRRADVSASGTTGNLGLYAGGYFGQRRDGWRAHSDFDKLSLTFRADYSLSSTTQLTATATTNHLDTDMTGDLDSLSFYGQQYSSLQTFTFRKVNATRFRTTLSHAWNLSGKTDLTVYYRNNSIAQNPHYRVRTSRTNPAQATGEENDNAFTSIGANVQHLQYLNFWDSRITTGLSIDRSPNTYEAFFITVDRDPASGIFTGYQLSDSLLSRYDIDLLNTGLYSQIEFSPIQRLRFVAGLRFDKIDYAFDNYLPPSAFTGAPDEENGFDHISPKLGLTYNLQNNRGFYANFSQGFLPPEVTELYRGVKVPTLKPSYFNNYEIGGWGSFANGKLYADVSIYRMNGEDEIISVRLEGGSSISVNAGRTSHQGIEYSLKYVPVSSISIHFGGTNATHEYVEYENSGVIYNGNEMEGAANWIANGGLTYHPKFLPGLRAGMEWQHIGEYYLDPENTETYPGYNILNLRFGYKISNAEIWTNIYNITDELYAVSATKTGTRYAFAPGMPFSLAFGVSYGIGR
ncbi:MAG: TonB-dependent receptor [Calditrichaeota bacterium]|nr:TonB-dependent receptor [Calditrichota bacterium]